ncbi:MAG: MFS transporter [Desulfarculaceae bacterium]|nr:MFS transporter [Desulfarculaceae bacterium]MCF8071257.1 MFS transporter [Desulfarculaceae bacterium]MCF8101140.1 MFS transporter [Desulfarculaceae bacterium]MCF8115311.1 MFS transporter [Desulfarculaceae bacterium]
MVTSTQGSFRRPGRRWLVFALCAALFMCSQFFRVSGAVIAPQLQSDLGLDPEQLGFLGACFFYAFATAQIPLALYLDRLGARVTMTGLSLLGGVGAVVFSMADTMTGAAVGRLLIGLGMAGNLMGPMKLFTNWFSPREFATLSGLIFSIGTMGNMMAATPLALMADALGWRWAFRAIGLATVLIALIFWWLVREHPEGASQTELKADAGSTMSTMQCIKTLLSNRNYWFASWGTFCRYGTFVAIQGLWAGPYLIEGLGYSNVQAGNLLVLLNLGLIIGSPLGGWLSDRVLNTRKWMAVIGMAALCLAELWLTMGWGTSSEMILGTGFFAVGLSASWGNIIYAHIKEVMPSQMTGMALTGVNFFTMAGGGFFLQFMGTAVQSFAPEGATGIAVYAPAFGMAFGAMALATLLYLFSQDAPRR